MHLLGEACIVKQKKAEPEKGLLRYPKAKALFMPPCPAQIFFVGRLQFFGALTLVSFHKTTKHDSSMISFCVKTQGKYKPVSTLTTSVKTLLCARTNQWPHRPEAENCCGKQHRLPDDCNPSFWKEAL